MQGTFKDRPALARKPATKWTIEDWTEMAAPSSETSGRHMDDGALQQRLFGVEKDVQDLRGAMNSGFSIVRDEQRAAQVATQASIQSIASKLDDRSRPQWQAYSLLFTACVALGALAYWPVRETQSDFKEQLRALPTRGEITSRLDPAAAAWGRVDTQLSALQRDAASKGDMVDRFAVQDARAALVREQYLDRFRRLETDMAEAEKRIVPRGEHEQRWASFERDVQNMQRQMDELKKNFGDTFSLRDALLQMQRRLDQIEQRSRAAS